MKRALEIIGKLYIGGAERVARDIGFYADPEKFQIDYVVFGNDIGAYEADLSAKGCRIFHIPPPSDGYRAYCGNLRKLIRENRYDIVHAHTMFNSGWAMLVAKKEDVPIRIAHSHTIRGPERRSVAQNLYEKTMRRVILHDATDLIGCGQAAGEWLFGRKAFQKRGQVILNGIDTGRFMYSESDRKKTREALGLTDRFVIGHVGHMFPVKNQAFLIRLLPELIKKRAGATLLFLGDGQDRPALNELACQLGVEDYVIMTGNVPDVWRYLSAMDVFAFPSLYEGMPLAIVEAQANGLPCVLSDRIPKDVFLTEQVTPLSLEADSKSWVSALLRAKRGDPEKSRSILRALELDTKSAMNRIYAIYSGVK